jgi:hypothetical protein
LIDAGVTDEGIAARVVAHGHCPEARALDLLDEMAAMRCACSGDCVTPTSYCFMALRETLILHWSWNASRA